MSDEPRHFALDPNTSDEDWENAAKLARMLREKPPEDAPATNSKDARKYE